jgi:hypothetical protein
MSEEEEGIKGVNRAATKVAADWLRNLCQEQLNYREVTHAHPLFTWFDAIHSLL